MVGLLFSIPVEKMNLGVITFPSLSMLPVACTYGIDNIARMKFQNGNRLRRRLLRRLPRQMTGEPMACAASSRRRNSGTRAALSRFTRSSNADATRVTP
jgi:hypothetical protein